MPSLLHYQVVTDPTSLRASLTDEPSLGTLYVIVSNSRWSGTTSMWPCRCSPCPRT
ncbi:hypothetical protein ACFQ0M_01160 [Kitasatospora aburaviensis]